VWVVIVWRRRDRVRRRELAGSDDHRGADFRRARLVGMDLRGKDLSSANLEWADLTEADVRYARLRGANLHGAYLTGAQLDGADLSGCRLDESYLLATDFGNATLEGATLVGAIWDQSTTWPRGFDPTRTQVGLWHGRRKDVAGSGSTD
jgi:uncharacterized protein YjbI with pentapeptide repeats